MSESKQEELLESVAFDLIRVESFLEKELTTGSEDFNRLIAPLSSAGGKRLRAQLCLLIACAGQSDETERIQIAAAVEMLHLATLIHDDVLDQADIRRGETTIHCKKGNKVAILSGDYLFAKAFEIVSRMSNMEYLKIFARIITCLVEGEFMQMEDVYRLDQGIDRYMAKTQKKTADFIEGCMELGAILGKWSAKDTAVLKKYGHALGMAFQITDDIMDYRETEATTGKPVGKDLREGLLTYPLLSIVNEDTYDFLHTTICNIHDGNERDLIQYVVNHGGINNTLVVEKQYTNMAVHALKELPDFSGKTFLYQAVDALATRKV